MDIEEAILAPRIHLEGNQLYSEPGIEIYENDIPNIFSIQKFEDKNLFFGGVNAVTVSAGFSDIRRGGTFEIV